MIRKLDAEFFPIYSILSVNSVTRSEEHLSLIEAMPRAAIFHKYLINKCLWNINHQLVF
jgi:hypothetical protein